MSLDGKRNTLGEGLLDSTKVKKTSDFGSGSSGAAGLVSDEREPRVYHPIKDIPPVETAEEATARIDRMASFTNENAKSKSSAEIKSDVQNLKVEIERLDNLLAKYQTPADIKNYIEHSNFANKFTKQAFLEFITSITLDESNQSIHEDIQNRNKQIQSVKVGFTKLDGLIQTFDAQFFQPVDTREQYYTTQVINLRAALQLVEEKHQAVISAIADTLKQLSETETNPDKKKKYAGNYAAFVAEFRKERDSKAEIQQAASIGHKQFKK